MGCGSVGGEYMVLCEGCVVGLFEVGVVGLC